MRKRGAGAAVANRSPCLSWPSMRSSDAAIGRPTRELPFYVLCAAVAGSMFRSVDEPSVGIHVGGTNVAVVPTDLAIAVLAVFCIGALLGRRSLPQPARSITAAAVAFGAWLLVSSALNGFTTLVGGVKVLEYGVLALGAILFVRRRAQLWQFVWLIVLLAAVADLWAIRGFFEHPGARQSSFTGAHDLAALCSMALIVTFAALFSRRHRLGRLPLAAGIVGVVGVVLGAALASLLGLYLGALAVVLLAAFRRALTPRPVVVTAVLLAVCTAGSLSLRQGELGFLNEWFGSTQNAAPGQYAASWSQRLVFTYIDGRVFEANPVVGTGWYGELPPKEWARFLPDAKRKFPDQPANYFPKPTADLIPQQTYDQVLAELGLVGGILFLALAVLTVRTAVRVGRVWPPGTPDEPAAYLPIGWTASLAGAIAGAALFGGIPITAIFWLTIGLVALVPSLAPPAPAPVEAAERPRVPATVS
jgi:O-antigen ligase/polysaccharide polymerase Wzy-like membrane protein